MALSLSPFHREQIAKYIKFFRTKREIQLGELHEQFQDAIETRLDAGALMSPEEVADLLGSLRDSIKSNVEEDLRRAVNMSVLAIQQLLEDADAQEVELQMDTSKIEDSHMLDEVEKIRLEGPNIGESSKKTGRLVSLRDEQQRIVDQNQQLETELARSRKENDALRDECDTVNKKLSNYTYELESLRRQLTAVKGKIADDEEKGDDVRRGAQSAVGLQNELDEERDRLSELRAELEDAKDILMEKYGLDFDEICRSFKNSKQFSQLRKTLTQKTEQLTDLRRRILAYEPDDVYQDTEYLNQPMRSNHK